MKAMKVTLYSFDAYKLFLYGRRIIKDSTLSLTYELTTLARSGSNDEENDDVERRRDCLLFDQIRKEFKDDPTFDIRNHLIQLDFKNAKESTFRKYQECRNGIVLNISGQEKVTFVEFLRSASMSRKSRTLFIDKDIFERIYKRVCFELIGDTDKVVLSKWYAYSGLCVSDCDVLDNIKLESKNVVIVKDHTKTVTTDALTAISIPFVLELMRSLIDCFKSKSEGELNNLAHNINAINNSKDYKELKKNESASELVSCFELLLENIKNNGKALSKLSETLIEYGKKENQNVIWYKVNVKDYIVTTSLFDGEGLCDNSFADELNNELSKIKGSKVRSYSFQIRMPFVKGVIHTCNLKRFFKDKNIEYIDGLSFDSKGTTQKYDVNDIKLILTESQFKIAKYIGKLNSLPEESKIDAYFRTINEYDYGFGVCNIEPTQSRKVRLNYEVLSTMPINKRDLKTILKQNDEDVFKAVQEENIDKRYLNGVDYYQDKYDLLNINKDFFRSTKLYQDDKEETFNVEKNNRMFGQISVKGQRKFLSGDLLDLLYRASGLTMPVEQELGVNEYHTNPYKCRREEMTSIVLLRNPHYSRNEIAILKPHFSKNDERVIYFPKLSGTIFINPSSLTAERLSGADYDGDQVIMVTQPEMLHSLTKNLLTVRQKEDEALGKHSVTVPKYNLIIIPGLTARAAKNNYENRYQCLRNTFYNIVGIISNSAFYMSFDCYKDKNRYDDVAFYTILSGLAIDCAKTGLKPQVKDYIVSYSNNAFANAFLEMKGLNRSKALLDKNIKKLESIHDSSILYTIVTHFLHLSLTNKKNKELKIRPHFNKEICKELIKIIVEYHLLFSYSSPLNEISDLIDEKENIYSLLQGRINDSEKDDLDEVVAAFESSNPQKMLSRYVNSDLKYHFMRFTEERRDFIRNYLPIKLIQNKHIKCVTNFDDEGYKTLYLILHYWSKKDDLNLLDRSKLYFKYFDVATSKVKKMVSVTAKNLDMDESKLIEDICVDIINDCQAVDIANIYLNKLTKEENRNLQFRFIELMKNRIPSKTKLEHVLSIDEEALDKSYLLSLFKEQLIQYLGKGEDE